VAVAVEEAAAEAVQDAEVQPLMRCKAHRDCTAPLSPAVTPRR